MSLTLLSHTEASPSQNSHSLILFAISRKYIRLRPFHALTDPLEKAFGRIKGRAQRREGVLVFPPLLIGTTQPSRLGCLPVCGCITALLFRLRLLGFLYLLIQEAHIQRHNFYAGLLLVLLIGIGVNREPA
jgi:hypothetical protein